uniref:Uncharacterized protein n=1 Tax=Hordeum vulgare subsp. vulgare TaxID=112509 RepID=A0A8I6WAM1_HORVV
MKCKTEPSLAMLHILSSVAFCSGSGMNPPLSLSLSLSPSPYEEEEQQTSEALIADSLTDRLCGCHITSLLLWCCQPAIPLPWIWLWRGLGTVEFCSDVSVCDEVWSADARYEQLPRLSKLLTTMASLMDGWMLLCDEEMEFLPGAMMMTMAEISMS